MFTYIFCSVKEERKMVVALNRGYVKPAKSAFLILLVTSMVAIVEIKFLYLVSGNVILD